MESGTSPSSADSRKQILNDKFLEELKLQYNKELEAKDSLETKANSIITISGTIATFLFGFGLFMIEKLGSTYSFIHLISVLLAIGLSGIILAIILSAWSYRTDTYRYAMIHKVFYKSEVLDEENVRRYENAPSDVFFDTMVRAYLRCNKQNSQNNASKAARIGSSLWFFILGIATIPAIIGILLIRLPSTPPS